MMGSRTLAGERKRMIIGWNRIRKAVQLECLPSSESWMAQMSPLALRWSLATPRLGAVSAGSIIMEWKDEEWDPL